LSFMVVARLPKSRILGPGNIYSRIMNLTCDVLEQAMAAMKGAAVARQ
jgi:O-acetylhomoserine/O-acetylserine sulfhydrylase-like pyridoxal-dependent enzyme